MREVKLTNSKLVTLVDDEDYNRVCNHQWRLHTGREHLTVEMGDRKNENYWCLSDFIMGVPPEGKIWDHKDRNSLNNQRENLRLATFSQNQANSKLRIDNTSKYKGVCFHVRMQKWQAYISKEKKIKHLGYFPSAEEAARVYDQAAINLFNEFANTNFPRTDYV